MHEQDLFMENIMMCSALCGFSDFYKLKWMNKISSWQHPIIGCFGDIGKIYRNDSHSEKSYNKDHLLRRVKRREKMFLGAAYCFGWRRKALKGSTGQRKREAQTSVAGQDIVSSVRDLCTLAVHRI
ncbi:protein homodimerization activity [Pristimantis euphronides]